MIVAVFIKITMKEPSSTLRVLLKLLRTNWAPNIVHIHGWISSLITIKHYYKDDPIFNDTKTIVSVYDDSFRKVDKNFKNSI